jgi:hypothetical protein
MEKSKMAGFIPVGLINSTDGFLARFGQRRDSEPLGAG